LRGRYYTARKTTGDIDVREGRCGSTRKSNDQRLLPTQTITDQGCLALKPRTVAVGVALSCPSKLHSLNCLDSAPKRVDLFLRREVPAFSTHQLAAALACHSSVCHPRVVAGYPQETPVPSNLSNHRPEPYQFAEWFVLTIQAFSSMP